MRFIRPRGVLAGFKVDFNDDPLAPLEQAGEQWLPQNRKIIDHANTGWELLYQARGRTDWKLGRRAFTLFPGGFYLIAPGVWHELVRSHGDDIHVYYTVFDPFRALAPSERFLAEDWPSFHTGRDAHTLVPPFQALTREVTLDQTAHAGLRIHLSALCLEIHRLLHATPPVRPVRDATLHPAALRARECLQNHPGHAWKLDELAALAGVSVPHLIDLFRQEFQKTPKQYLIRLRLERAMDLLGQTDRTITEIALDLGFSSSQHFANCFRRHFGCAPREARQADWKTGGAPSKK